MKEVFRNLDNLTNNLSIRISYLAPKSDNNDNDLLSLITCLPNFYKLITLRLISSQSILI